MVVSGPHKMLLASLSMTSVVPALSWYELDEPNRNSAAVPSWRALYMKSKSRSKLASITEPGSAASSNKPRAESRLSRARAEAGKAIAELKAQQRCE